MLTAIKKSLAYLDFIHGEDAVTPTRVEIQIQYNVL